MLHIVQYRESERGWGGEIWFRGFATKEEADKEIFDCNKDLPEKTPDYYILASYIGTDEKVPESYKI